MRSSGAYNSSQMTKLIFRYIMEVTLLIEPFGFSWILSNFIKLGGSYFKMYLKIKKSVLKTF